MTFSPPTPLTFSPPSLSNHPPYSPPTLLFLLTPSPHHPNLHLTKSNPYKFKPKPQSFPPTSPDPLLHDPHPFLSPQDSKNLQTLSTFSYTHQFDHGSLTIRSMDPSETDATASLLAESFAESMLVPGQYTSILAFLVRQYLMERRALVPHATMLVGYYRRSGVGEGEEEGEVLAGTAEVSFDARGANASPPTPVPPRDLPYICNMTVRKGLRRKGIGWQLLKACEELICKMKGSSDVYLHCRVVDTGPYKMYKRAEYEVVKTDNFLIWLTLQRRKHLMRKQLKCE